MTKAEKLADLKKRMVEDKSLPLREGATQLVFGDGAPDADIYFLGEAPGFYEDREGKPFVGNAGKLLNKLLKSINLDRSKVYISNIVRFRPPNNRDPEESEISAFAPFVDEEIEIIDPEVIITLGRFSMNKFLPGSKISQIHGKIFKVNWEGKERIVIPMFHPAAALRQEAIMKQIYEDFAKVPEILLKKKEAAEEKKEQEKKLDEPTQLGLIEE